MAHLTFRTAPPVAYIPPDREEMSAAAEAVGLKKFAPDLVADLCNLAAGGSVQPPSAYREVVRQRVEETQAAPDHNGWLGINLRDGKPIYVKTRQQAVQCRSDAMMRYHQNVCDFLQAVDLDRFPGNTPLERAMALLKLLSQKKGGQGAGDAGGEPLPIFQDTERPEAVAEQLHGLMEQVESLSQEELDMLDPEGEKHAVTPDPEEQSEDSEKQDGKQKLNALKIAEDLQRPEHAKMLEVSRKLDDISRLQVRRRVELEPDPAGREVRQRQMSHIGELSRVARSSWAMYAQNRPYFWMQAATNQLPVRERVTRNEKKQAIYLLIDGSGSMSGIRHYIASGVVMNRLKSVILGDAIVWVSVFDTSLSTAEKAETPEEARALIKKFGAGNFKGGGTDIAASVKAAHAFMEDEINKGAALYRPEVIVLSDEDPSAGGVTAREIPGTTVHGFAILRYNPALMNLARSTGGVGIENFGK